MTRSPRLVGTLIGMAFVLLSHSVCGQQSSKPIQRSHPAATAPQLPAAPKTPEEMPPSPPIIACSGHELTIIAQNSTLESVLTGIRACTGAQIIIPEGTGSERLFAEVGPGPIRTVITDLLSSTDFNYVIQASQADPQKIHTVLLSPRTDDSQMLVADANRPSPNWRTWIEAQQNHGQPVQSSQDESGQGSGATSADSAETAMAPASSSPVEERVMNSVTAVSPFDEPTDSAVASASLEAGAEAKDTEQLIADLRRLYDRRKQMVEQQTPSAQ